MFKILQLTLEMKYLLAAINSIDDTRAPLYEGDIEDGETHDGGLPLFEVLIFP